MQVSARIKAYELSSLQASLLHHFKRLGVSGSAQYETLFSDIEDCFNLIPGQAKVIFYVLRYRIRIQIVHKAFFKDHREKGVTSRSKDISTPGDNLIYEKAEIEDLTLRDLKEISKWSRSELQAAQPFCGPLTMLAEICHCAPELATSTLQLFKDNHFILPGADEDTDNEDERLNHPQMTQNSETDLTQLLLENPRMERKGCIKTGNGKAAYLKSLGSFTSEEIDAYCNQHGCLGGTFAARILSSGCHRWNVLDDDTKSYWIARSREERTATVEGTEVLKNI